MAHISYYAVGTLKPPPITENPLKYLFFLHQLPLENSDGTQTRGLRNLSRSPRSHYFRTYPAAFQSQTLSSFDLVHLLTHCARSPLSLMRTAVSAFQVACAAPRSTLQGLKSLCRSTTGARRSSTNSRSHSRCQCSVCAPHCRATSSAATPILACCAGSRRTTRSWTTSSDLTWRSRPSSSLRQVTRVWCS